MNWIALIGPELEENLGIRYISSSLKKAGFATAIIPFNTGGDLAWTLKMIHSAQEPPLMVAISLSFQVRAMDCLALVMALREGGYRGHITGGCHFGYFCRKELLADFNELDSICCGEAEETVVDLARALADGLPLDDLAGLCHRGPHGLIIDTPARPAPDIVSLPWPDREGSRASCLGHPIAAIVGGRGCYGNCSFCCIAAWHRSNSANKPYRIRPAEDIADEMAWLNVEQGIEIFIFHDDNFFLPRKQDNLDRIHELATLLKQRGIGRFATMVKARPTDISREIITAMKKSFGLYRIFLGVENDSSQGLATLRRGVLQRQNHEAMEALTSAGIYTCFNLLLFEPDATIESIRTNLAFMTAYGGNPFFFGRVELYAGTPLLDRMQQEQRAHGSYMNWDYRLHDPSAQLAFELYMHCFYQRNFSPLSPVLRLMAVKHDSEICRIFHPEVFQHEWLRRANSLCQRIADDTVMRMGAILDIAARGNNGADAMRQVSDFSKEMPGIDAGFTREAENIEAEVHAAVGRGCCHDRSLPQTLTNSHPFAPDGAFDKTQKNPAMAVPL